MNEKRLTMKMKEQESAHEHRETADENEERQKISDDHRRIVDEGERREITDEQRNGIDQECEVVEDEQKIEKRWTDDEDWTRIADGEQRRTNCRQEHIEQQQQQHKYTHAENDHEDAIDTQIAIVSA